LEIIVAMKKYALISLRHNTQISQISPLKASLSAIEKLETHLSLDSSLDVVIAWLIHNSCNWKILTSILR